MTRRITTILAGATVLGLAACSAPVTPGGIGGGVDRARVAEVYLYQHSLSVLTTSGQLCTAQKPRDAGLSWSGQLAGCDHPWPFRVEQAAKVNPLRLVLEEVGLTPLLAPVAKVTITDGSGREKLFASPPDPEL